jgi:hypothetical protein
MFWAPQNIFLLSVDECRIFKVPAYAIPWTERGQC